MYDSTQDTINHIKLVQEYLSVFIGILEARGRLHDKSKLEEPEKTMYDKWIPRLKTLEFGSEEYKNTLVAMQDGLKHHYENNDHHPEYSSSGVYNMSLFSLTEMLADWLASSARSGKPVDLKILFERFDIRDQLANIIRNTIENESYSDVWKKVAEENAK